MRPIPLQSGRNLSQSAECAIVSILAHGLFVWFALGMTEGSRQLPTNEREARVFFLLPPDRVDVRERQTEIFQWGKPGGDLENGRNFFQPDAGWPARVRAHGARGRRDRSGARAEVPFGPMLPFVPDTIFSVLQVDETVERYEGSAAPAYPRDLLAMGAEGLVQAIYVVDTTGTVDPSSVQVVSSNDSRFTASVLTALGQMRFRPAKRAGKTVRQLVEQKFRFRIVPASELAEQIS